MYAQILINYCILLHFRDFIPSYNSITKCICSIANRHSIDITSLNSQCISGIAVATRDRESWKTWGK